jgi:hypothetical protein
VLHFTGSRPAMTRLAVAPPWTAASSINLGRATPVIPIAIRRPSSPPCRPLLNEMVNAPRQQTAGAEIPIASDALLRQISRGFLPWRFADAGPGVRGAVAMGRHPKTFTEGAIQQQISILLFAYQSRLTPFYAFPYQSPFV